MIFQNFIASLDALGVTDVLLPFILVFTVVFAVLQKSEILGKDKKNFNVMIALVMALSVVIPHVVGRYPFNFDPVLVINSVLPQVSLVIVAILMMLIIIGVFGKKFNIAGTPLSTIVVIGAFVAIVLIFGSTMHWFYLPNWLYFLHDSQLQALIIMILVFGLIIAFITGDNDKKSKEDREKGIGKFFSKIGDSIEDSK